MWFGPLKRFQKLFFHTPLVNVFILGSEAYHDYYRWPLKDKKTFEEWRRSTHWGRSGPPRWAGEGGSKKKTRPRGRGPRGEIGGRHASGGGGAGGCGDARSRRARGGGPGGCCGGGGGGGWGGVP